MAGCPLCGNSKFEMGNLEFEHVPDGGWRIAGEKPGQGARSLLLDSFDPVLKNVDQLVGGKQGFDGGPNFLKKTVKFAFSHVAEAESDDPWRRAREHDSVGKIGVFADDDETFVAGEVPDRLRGEPASRE